MTPLGAALYALLTVGSVGLVRFLQYLIDRH